MINRGGIDDLLLARKMARLATVQDVQNYQEGGEATPIKLPRSLKELQDWKNPFSEQALMERLFSDRKEGVKGAPIVAMPANIDELLSYMKAKRKGYADGGETDSDQIDQSTRDIYDFDLGNGYSITSEGDVVSNTPAQFRDESNFSGPISRFGTEITEANIAATKPPTTSPSGNFDIYGGLGGGTSVISPPPAPNFRSTEFSDTPLEGPFVSPVMTAARMKQNPVSEDFNYKAMQSLDPWFQTKAAGFINRLIDTGIDPNFSSGSRTVSQQKGLYDNPSPYGAAPPGFSAHNFGQAFDLGGLTNKQMIDAGLMAEAEGLGWGGRFKTYDPVHFQEMPSTQDPSKYAKETGTSLFKGTSVFSPQTVSNVRPEPFDIGGALSKRVSETFTPGGIGSLVLGAAVPPIGVYNTAAGLVNFMGGNLPTTTSMINERLGITPPEAAQAPRLPPPQPDRPVTLTPTTDVADIYTSSGPKTRMQVADLSGTTVPTEQTAVQPPADLSGTTVPTEQTAVQPPAEKSWWDSLFDTSQVVQDVLNKPNTVNPGYPNTTSGLTKEKWASQMQVDPDTVKARVSTMNGVPQVDWYTKGLDEIFSGSKTKTATTETATTETPSTYIPTGGIGDHQTIVAQNLFAPTTGEPLIPAKKPIYPIWPPSEEGYSGPYAKYLI